MSTKNIHNCDFCKKESYNVDDVIYERVVVTGSRKYNIKWEDICESCFQKLQQFIPTLRKG